MSEKKEKDKNKVDEHANTFFAEFLVIRDKKTEEELHRGRG